MIIVNAAPIDQSGRTVSLAEYYKKKGELITLLTYKGERSVGFISPSITIEYMKMINTKNSRKYLRMLLLLVKLVYLNTAVSMCILGSLISRKNRRKRAASVLFVVPPSYTFFLPIIIAWVLRLRIIIDWHRVEQISLLSIENILARAGENLAVTESMRRYFSDRNIKNIKLKTDAYLSKNIGRNKVPRNSLKTRKEVFEHLVQKYPEYRKQLLLVKQEAAIGVCSTSFSKEENIQEMLDSLSLIRGVSGTLFLTTKKRVESSHPCIDVVQVFLDYPDYLLLLSIADFGVSTHQCSYDYPLKIVDYVQHSLCVIAHSSTPKLDSPEDEAHIFRYGTAELRNALIAKMYSREQRFQAIQ